MKKILVAVDGSKNSEKAILKTRALAQLNGSEVTLLNVINDAIMNNPYVTRVEHKEAIHEAYTEQGNTVLEKSLEIFGPYEGNIRAELKHGDPGKTIIEIAEKEGYDLVVMGSRGLNTISRAMLGSVSNKVVNHIHVSVLIVK